MNTPDHTSATQTDAQMPHEAATSADPQAEQNAMDAAARSVMHPDWHDTDWRYYFGAWGG